MEDKTKGCIRIDSLDAWNLQSYIKPGQVWAPGSAFSPSDVYFLRKKINSAILRFEDEKGLASVDIPITETEAWVIDSVLTKDTPYSNSKNILVQTFRILWETEYDLQIKNSSSGDTKFDDAMLKKLTEWDNPNGQKMEN